MDRRGIDVQVLSVNVFWWYSANVDDSRRIVLFHDQKLAEWCSRYPDRFIALSSPALQHPELAADQLEHAVMELGHRGAAIGGHCEGESLSSPRFDVFWRRAEELGVPVFMHPNGATNVAMRDALSGPGDLPRIVGDPLETTIFLSRLIFDGVFDRFPNLQVVAAHGGGYLPSYLGRTEVSCAVRPNASCVNQFVPSVYLRRQVYVDTLVFSEEGLRHLVNTMGAERLVYGSDIPFVWPDSIDPIVDASWLTAEQKRRILGENLLRALGITVH
jgi:aminocarboxymuconate-semialdehyde decarboxylase